MVEVWRAWREGSVVVEGCGRRSTREARRGRMGSMFWLDGTEERGEMRELVSVAICRICCMRFVFKELWAFASLWVGF